MTSLYYFDDPTTEEGTRRFERTALAGAEHVQHQDYYRCVIRMQGRDGWVFRFRALDKYARQTHRNLNVVALDEVAA